MNEIIPFGKYKNQPIEVLAGDKQYTEWLCQQSWFISQFNQLHTVIINNFNQPSETPEHNKMVANFLEDKVCENLVKKYFYGSKMEKDFIEDKIEAYINYQRDLISKLNRNESKMQYRSEDECGMLTKENKIIKKKINNCVEVIELLQKGNNSYNCHIKSRQFETNSDVSLVAIIDAIDAANDCIAGIMLNLDIECKPILSEDFPAVLRQCKNQKSKVLVVEKYICESISFNQLKDFFGEIKIFMLSELI